MKTNRKQEKYCPKCDSKLEAEKEKEIDYPYVCKSCDENFYEFETIERVEKYMMLNQINK